MDAVPARGRRRTLITALTVTVAVAIAMILAAAAYAYVQDKYYNSGDLCAHCETFAGYDASRQWNKVYRPIGIHFCLQYLGTSCVYNTWDNPFIDNRTAFNDNAGCWDDDTVGSYPTTCITTFPG